MQTQYNSAPRALIAMSEQLKALSEPKHKTGELVIVPNDKGRPIHAVVQFACADPERKGKWIYAVTIASDLNAATYFAEHLLISSNLIRA